MTGWQTLFYKEVLRFWKVSFQTVAAPVLTAVLYLLIFGHVLEDHVKVYDRISYTAFLVPGLVMMSVLQNAFANSSSSLIQSKMMGNLVFLMLTPLSHRAWFVAYVGSSALRGLVVGAGVLVDGSAGQKTTPGSRMEATGHAQGFALEGLGLLWAGAADDTLIALTHAQGSAGPGGAAWLINAGGNDRYELANTRLVQASSQLPQRNASMGQGAGRGWRGRGGAPDVPGGMGLSFDWSLLAGHQHVLPWGLAGGLDPDNVGEALAATHAPLVDVSSGVEASRGVKDPEKIARFLANAASL